MHYLEDYKVGDSMVIELKNGREFRLPIVEILGGKMWLDDGRTRLQVNMSTGNVLILSDKEWEPVIEYYI